MNQRSIKFACLLCLLLITASHPRAQGKIRVVEGPRELYRNQPIEIIDWELGNRAFLDKNRIVAEDDWLKDLTLSVKNISAKSIASFDIHLLIQKEGKIVMGIPVYFRTYVNPSDGNSLTVQGEKKLGYLLPGETVKVRVTDRVMALFGKEFVRYGVESIDRVTIDIRAVYFEDRSRWMFGMESKPDPNNPDKRIRLDQP